MNKYDISLIISLLFLSIILIIFSFENKTDNKIANIYYENDLILEIDLNTDMSYYEVEGYNGSVIFYAGDGMIKVAEEISPLNLCSKQGYIENSYETIICLPNKIIVEIQYLETIDSIVK
ncbi:MAG: NusG domain II-containing protein [Mycoplasmatota bacterium]